MSELTLADVMKEIGKVEGQLEALHRRVDQQSKDISELKKIANMGRGGLYVALKFGGLIAFVVGVAITIWKVATP